MLAKTVDFLKLHPDALDMENFDARKRRGIEHSRAGDGLYRRFGYFRSQKSPFSPALESLSGHSKADKVLIEKLVTIERYAGYIMLDSSEQCMKCHGVFRIGYRDFVFRPLPGGFTYRWPETLMHYFKYHNAATHEWMKELVLDFEKAQRQGLWR